MGYEEADLDLNRRERCGFPEVVYGEGKSTELILSLFEKQQEAGQNSLVTRVSAETASILLSRFPQHTIIHWPELSDFNTSHRSTRQPQVPPHCTG